MTVCGAWAKITLLAGNYDVDDSAHVCVSLVTIGVRLRDVVRAYKERAKSAEGARVFVRCQVGG